jgi:4-azaleucine resistance transporter AzlC
MTQDLLPDAMGAPPAAEPLAVVEPLTYSRRSEFVAGMKATFPLVVGAIPFGIIFGAVAVNAGISSWTAAAMSAFVFAGASQFVAAGLVASSAGLLIIIVTTFVVNLRHSLYSVTLAPFMRHLPQRWLLLLGFTLTDETFLVVVDRYRQNDASPNKHWYHFGSAAFMYTNWQLCTWIGIIAGQTLPNPAGWGLDFALVVTFIGMLMPGLSSRPAVVCATAAGAASILFAALPNRLGLILAALIGVAAGIAAERLVKVRVQEMEEAG